MAVFIVLVFFINVITVKILSDDAFYLTYLLIILIVAGGWHGVCGFFCNFVG